MKNLLVYTFFLLISGTMYSQDIMLLKTSGKVVIGDTSLISTPGPYNLYVQNGILTEKVKVALRSASDWSDNAFDKTPSLQDVEKSIETNSHLIDMPSAQQLEQSGYDVTSMDAKLLAQIEWLWQHTIELSKQNKALRAEIELLKKDSKTNIEK